MNYGVWSVRLSVLNVANAVTTFIFSYNPILLSLTSSILSLIALGGKISPLDIQLLNL